MAYFGFEHHHGENMRDNNGDFVGRLYIFDKKDKRDKWVDDGGEYRTKKGYRTNISHQYAARWKRIGGAVEDASLPHY